MLVGMDDLQHVPKSELLKRDLATLTPQQKARALVQMNKQAALEAFCDVMTGDEWKLIYQKLVKRAKNGHVKSAEFLSKVNGTIGIKPPEELQAAQAPTVVYIDNADRREMPRSIESEVRNG